MFHFITVGEILLGSHGRCGFRRYMPNKLRKYSIIVSALEDAKMFYTSTMKVDFGKQANELHAKDTPNIALFLPCLKYLKNRVTEVLSIRMLLIYVVAIAKVHSEFHVLFCFRIKIRIIVRFNSKSLFFIIKYYVQTIIYSFK